MVARYFDIVFDDKESRNVANCSVEFQGHEKKVVQVASASSVLFRMYGTLDQVHRNACVFWHTPVENGFKAAGRPRTNGGADSEKTKASF